MARRRSTFDTSLYARLGVQARLSQVQQELAVIRRAFPGVIGSGRETSAASGATVDGTPRRRRRKLSAPVRKATRKSGAVQRTATAARESHGA